MNRWPSVPGLMARHTARLFALGFALALSSCGDSSDGDGDPGPQGCVPSRDDFESTALPIIQSKCSVCHGSVPDNGAPFSLLEYDALVRGAQGSRVVDRMVKALSTGFMPPSDRPQPTETERTTLINWASCK